MIVIQILENMSLEIGQVFPQPLYPLMVCGYASRLSVRVCVCACLCVCVWSGGGGGWEGEELRGCRSRVRPRGLFDRLPIPPDGVRIEAWKGPGSGCAGMMQVDGEG